ncbi:TetR/AcrR family transcriptional regulator C-terminal domain-containing protein [Nonomuraea sp. NPDC052265]|uniref:TetR/AcrR family transcriptional regulator C-terminal domain-containing protein n=1 Tax=Nonomuraea sp. NPDC052265 TaxID=3364374 RepID=UPI0037C5EB73
MATPGTLGMVERAAALTRAGFTAKQALHVINAVSTFVIGHTLAEDHRERFDLAVEALLSGLAPRTPAAGTTARTRTGRRSSGRRPRPPAG